VLLFTDTLRISQSSKQRNWNAFQCLSPQQAWNCNSCTRPNYTPATHDHETQIRDANFSTNAETKIKRMNIELSTPASKPCTLHWIASKPLIWRVRRRQVFLGIWERQFNSWHRLTQTPKLWFLGADNCLLYTTCFDIHNANFNMQRQDLGPSW